MSLHDTPISSLGLVNETAIATGDMIFTADEFDNLHYQFIRNLAAQAKTDEINGKSNRLEVRAYFVRQRTLPEFVGQNA
jgi:hypothetical protein